MATTAGNKLTLDPMGKCSNAYFSETTNMIKAKFNFISEQKNLNFVDGPSNEHSCLLWIQSDL
jgi:hypothetical protein